MGGFNVTKNRNIVTLHLFLFSLKSIRQRPYCDPTPVHRTTTAQLWPHTCLCLHRKTHDNGPVVTTHLPLSSHKNTRQRPYCDPTPVLVRTEKHTTTAQLWPHLFSVFTEKHTTTALLWPYTCLCPHRLFAGPDSNWPQRGAGSQVGQ